MEERVYEEDIETEIQNEDTTPHLTWSNDDEDEDGLELFEHYTPVEEIPFSMMKHIKTTMEVRYGDRDVKEITAFLDTGSPSSFTGEELI